MRWQPALCVLRPSCPLSSSPCPTHLTTQWLFPQDLPLGVAWLSQQPVVTWVAPSGRPTTANAYAGVVVQTGACCGGGVGWCCRRAEWVP